MSAQRGKNRSGLSGVLVDLPGISAAKFHGDCVRWNLKRDGAAKPRRGRGGTYYTAYRYLTSDGGGFIYLEKIDGDWSEPDVFKGQTGSLVYIIHGSRKITVPIMVTGAEYQEDLSKDVAPLVLSYVTTGAAVFTGWPGTQPAATDPTMSDLQLWDGTQFTRDPNNLQDNATITIDWWGAITDSNAGDVAKLDAKIAAYIAPFVGMKLKTASFTRDSQNGGTIVFACSHTDTAEDVINPATQATTDPFNLTNNATVAAINATPAQPAGSFVRRDTRVSEIHDTAELRVSSFGTRTTKDDVEMPGTFYRPDVSDLESIGKQTFEYQQDVLPVPLPTVPAGLQIVGYTKQNIDQFNATVVYDLAKDTNRQKWEQSHSETVEDPSGITSKQTKGGVDFLPTLDPGYVERGISITQITHDHQGFVVDGGLRSTISDITYPGSITISDPWKLEDQATRTDVSGSSSPTTPPTVPGMIFRVTESERIHDTAWKYQHKYGDRDTKDDIEMPGTEIVTDGSVLKSSAQETLVYDTNGLVPGTTITPPTDTKVIETAVQEINQYKSKKVVKWGMRTSEQEIEWLDSKTKTGTTGGYLDRAIVVEVTTSSSPSTPSNPDATNLSFDSSDSFRLTDTRYVHAYTFLPLSAEENLEADGTIKANDPNAVPLLADDREAVYTNSATPPTTPDHSARNQYCVRVNTQRKSKVYYLHTFFYAYRTNEQKLEADKTWTEVDVSSLESVAMTADVWTGSAPSTPTLSGFVLISYRDITTDNPTYTLRVYSWGLVTNANKIIYAGSGASANPLSGYESEVVTIESDSTHTDTELAQTALADLQDEATFKDVEYKRITPDYVRKTVTRTLADKVRHGFQSSVVLDSFRGRWAALRQTSAEVHIFIDGIFTGGPGGVTRGNVVPTFRYRKLASFSLRRRIVITTAAPLANYYYEATIGLVNNATFLGKPTNTVMYIGPEIVGYSDEVSGDRVVEIDYAFKYDSEGFVIDGALPVGNVSAYQTLLFPGNGWYDPAFYVDPTCVLAWPGQGVFSVFLA